MIRYLFCSAESAPLNVSRTEFVACCKDFEFSQLPKEFYRKISKQVFLYQHKIPCGNDVLVGNYPETLKNKRERDFVLQARVRYFQVICKQFLGILFLEFQDFFGIVLEFFGIVWEFWEVFFGILLEFFWNSFGIILEFLWEFFGNSLEILQECFGNSSGNYLNM